MPPSAALATPPAERFAEDVAQSLASVPRQLPARYFYDELGSALFEAICQLPWYRITRDEQRLLEARGGEIMALAGAPDTLIELGPGSGEKLATLLAVAGVQSARVHLIDVSAAALDLARRTLSRHGGLAIVTHEAEYERGLATAAKRRAGAQGGDPGRMPAAAMHGAAGVRRDTPAQANGRTLALFLGSNIGNFHPGEAADLLARIRTTLLDGDCLLLGTDLVKPESELILAYDDPLGVTAAFNRNLLVRMNRELGADFDLDRFAHRAVWNAHESRVEMHLVSQRRHVVRIPAAQLELSFGTGENIWTESSYKFEPAGVRAVLGSAGFEVRRQWQEGTFALTLAAAS